MQNERYFSELIIAQQRRKPNVCADKSQVLARQNNTKIRQTKYNERIHENYNTYLNITRNVTITTLYYDTLTILLGRRPRDQPGVVKNIKVLSKENISPYDDKYDKIRTSN